MSSKLPEYFFQTFSEQVVVIRVVKSLYLKFVLEFSVLLMEEHKHLTDTVNFDQSIC